MSVKTTRRRLLAYRETIRHHTRGERLAFDDHKALGLAFCDMANALTAAYVFLANNYPEGKGSPLVALIRDAEKALGALRSELDEVVYIEQRDHPHREKANLYYGQGAERRRFDFVGEERSPRVEKQKKQGRKRT